MGGMYIWEGPRQVSGNAYSFRRRRAYESIEQPNIRNIHRYLLTCIQYSLEGRGLEGVLPVEVWGGKPTEGRGF